MEENEIFDTLAVADMGEEASFADLPTIAFENEKGETEDWKLVDFFEHRKRNYVALIPLSEAKNGGNNISIHLMRIELTSQNGVEGCIITAIPSDMEYDEVAAVFDKRVCSANL